MDNKVSLRSVVEELVSLPDDFVAYLDRRSGAIFSFSEADLRLADADKEHGESSQYPEWQREVIRKAREVIYSEHYVCLPVSSEIGKNQIVERFCEAIDNFQIRAEILQLVKQNRDFLAFKDAVRRHGLEQQWYDYEYAELAEVAVQWLEARQIPYLRDVESRQAEGA
ncbi:MAG: hypothetical protein JXA90_09405 [Planctomycetes bacterium]|nr:hypothetical protein [Planctomycetota bacterium]